MRDGSTITSTSLGRRDDNPQAAQPYLVVIASCEDSRAPSSRHLLEDIDEVWFKRGPRGSERTIHDGLRILELRVPDPRMSSTHGRLVRGPVGWVLDDPSSKNGTVVNGEVVRHAIIGDGALIEIGRTFLRFCQAVVEAGAALDLAEHEHPAAAPALITFAGPLADRFAALVRLAHAPVSVVLTGETGTGKEVIARTLHALSGRTGQFVAVNCGALPPSLIEAELFGHRRGAFTGAVSERPGLIRSAEGGTLFLDEIGELPLASQTAFLRVLQEREVVPVGDDRPIKVDVRLCVATHRDLAQLTERGEFREDLYARLSGFVLELPPLRTRQADFGIVLHALLAKIPGGTSVKFEPGALRALVAHDWRLNIRDLEKVLLTAVTLADDHTIKLAHLPAHLRHGASGSLEQRRAALPASEPVPASPISKRASDDQALRDRIVGLLTAHDGNVAAVSAAMGARRTQMYRWARRLGIDVGSFRRR